MQDEAEQKRKEFDTTIAKLMAETAKINAEAAKISTESRYYPALIIAMPILVLILQTAYKAAP